MKFSSWKFSVTCSVNALAVMSLTRLVYVLGSAKLTTALQRCFKSSRSANQEVQASQSNSEDSQALSRRQALLLGAGTLAASSFTAPGNTLAESPEVTAVGIKSAETVQLGQSGPVPA